MSDYYLALVDPTADAWNAQRGADALRDTLIAERIILAETTPDCVYSDVGHPAGPRLNESYVFAAARPDWPPEVRYWDSSEFCGVEFQVGKWGNAGGFTVFEWARCPSCGQSFGSDSELMSPLMKAVGDFIDLAGPSMLTCPACQAEQVLQSWVTQPHLGFCHLAVVFWNWPRFDAPGWRISIPEIASRAIGGRLIETYGRI